MVRAFAKVELEEDGNANDSRCQQVSDSNEV